MNLASVVRAGYQALIERRNMGIVVQRQPNTNMEAEAVSV
jgi:hypothetical protein